MQKAFTFVHTRRIDGRGREWEKALKAFARNSIDTKKKSKAKAAVNVALSLQASRLFRFALWEFILRGS